MCEYDEVICAWKIIHDYNFLPNRLNTQFVQVQIICPIIKVFLIAFISLCLGMDPHDVIDGINDGSIEVPEE